MLQNHRGSRCLKRTPYALVHYREAFQLMMTFATSAEGPSGVSTEIFGEFLESAAFHPTTRGLHSRWLCDIDMQPRAQPVLALLGLQLYITWLTRCLLPHSYLNPRAQFQPFTLLIVEAPALHLDLFFQSHSPSPASSCRSNLEFPTAFSL